MKDKLEFNEENRINLVVEKDGLKREMFYQGKPIQELIKYKDMWQKLKEWLKNQITDLRRIEIKTKTQSLRVNDAVNCFREVLYKMQEL